jgi:hypothetical protein
MGQIVAYCRVSTKKQDIGLSAQQAAIARFCAEYGHEVVETLVEKETGKGLDAAAIWSAGLSAFSASGLSSADSD